MQSAPIYPGAVLNDLTLQQTVLRFFAMLVIIAVHGVAVAGAASALGDPGPRYDGRLRTSPISHLDLLGLASGVFFSVGWIKPIAIDNKALRLWRVALVVASPVVTIVAVIIALRQTRPFLLPLLSDAWSTLTFALIDTIGQLGIWFAMVNLLPIPPFTGGHLLAALAPAARDVLHRSHIYAALLVLVIAATGIITRVLEPVHHGIAQILLGD
jgi:Zn-dependent protease